MSLNLTPFRRKVFRAHELFFVLRARKKILISSLHSQTHRSKPKLDSFSFFLVFGFIANVPHTVFFVCLIPGARFAKPIKRTEHGFGFFHRNSWKNEERNYLHSFKIGLNECKFKLIVSISVSTRATFLREKKLRNKSRFRVNWSK